MLVVVSSRGKFLVLPRVEVEAKERVVGRHSANQDAPSHRTPSKVIVLWSD